MYPGNRIGFHVRADGGLIAWAGGSRLHIDPWNRIVNLQYPSAASTDAQALATFGIIETLRFAHRFAVHAGVVAWERGAVLICAPSGAGKTTLTAAWAGLGTARFVTDDRCILFEEEGQVLAGSGARAVCLLPGTEALLSGLGLKLPRERAIFGKKSVYDARELLGATERGPLPVSGLLVLGTSAAQSRCISQCDSRTAITKLFQSSLYHGAPGPTREHFEILGRLLAQAPAYLVPRHMDCGEFVSAVEDLDLTPRLRRRPRSPASQKFAARGERRRFGSTLESLSRICAVGFGQGALDVGVRSREGSRSAGNEDELASLKGLVHHEWSDLVWLAAHHDILAFVAQTVAATSAIALAPPDLPPALHQVLRWAKESRASQITGLEDVSAILAESGIRWCVVGPVSIAERAYAFPETRSRHHIDLIVSRNELEIVSDLLGGLGFRSAVTKVGRDSISANRGLMMQRNGVRSCRIQLHTALPSLAEHGVGPPEGALAAVREAGVGTLPFPVLPMGQEILLACHRALDSSNGQRLSTWLDVALLSQRASNDDVRELREQAEAGGWTPMVAFCLSAASALSGRPMARELSWSLPRARLGRLLQRWVSPKRALLEPWTFLNKHRSDLVYRAFKRKLV